MSQTEKQKIGALGEDLACLYLKKRGYQILDRNYLKKWGEIDIVAKKGNQLHFVEVKSVSRPNVRDLDPHKHQPEENVHRYKIERLSRAIGSYLLEKKVPEDVSWQIDVIAVFIDVHRKEVRCRMLENVIL